MLFCLVCQWRNVLRGIPTISINSRSLVSGHIAPKWLSSSSFSATIVRVYLFAIPYRYPNCSTRYGMVFTRCCYYLGLNEDYPRKKPFKTRSSTFLLDRNFQLMTKSWTSFGRVTLLSLKIQLPASGYLPQAFRNHNLCWSGKNGWGKRPFILKFAPCYNMLRFNSVRIRSLFQEGSVSQALREASRRLA